MFYKLNKILTYGVFMLMNEFEEVNFGDERLNSRGRQILNSFFNRPGASINGSFNGWAESKACYRFFENDKVTCSKILEPHRLATLNRIAEHDIVLCVQDTTIIDYSHFSESIEGIGKLREEHEQGFLMHPTIAFSSAGLCLGVLHNKIWNREFFLGKSNRNKRKPVEDKESFRWIESYRLMQQIARKYPDKTFINIADREGDFYELLHEYNAVESENAHILVRAKSDRVLDLADGGSIKLWDELRKQPILCKLKFDLQPIKRHKLKSKLREGGEIEQEVRVKRIVLSPPKKTKQFKSFPPISLSAVLCSEVNCDGDGIEWLLLSSMPINTAAAAQRLIDYYTLRWQIELFFKVLKSGCKIEELQLEHIDRLSKCITMYMIIAWRLLFLSKLSRESPELPCDLFFSESEWKSAFMIFYKCAPPVNPPDIKAMNRIISTFGGFLNRKSDKEPGIKAMWIGIQRLRDFALAYETFYAKTYG